ncbi:MAG: phage tail protein I [Moraxellaceae bacterium]|nr:phage tail protein I [Moraxellaceae bacterium]
MTDTLLPANATLLERAAAEACARATTLDVPLRDLWSPERCPLALLPLLAWAFSVDRWDPEWSEAAKRAVIRHSFSLHAHKGTIAALRRVVEPLGFLITITEWWETVPPGPRGTFTVDIGVLDTGITDQMFHELERLIDDVKPVSRHLLGLAIQMEVRGTAYLGALAHDGETTTVHPYAPGPITSAGGSPFAGASHLIDTLSVHP